MARRRIREANLHSLPIHHQVLYGLVRVEGPLAGSVLHKRYEAVADSVYEGRPETPISPRSRRTKLSKLVDYDLLEVEGENRHQTFSVCDEDVGPPVAISLHHSLTDEAQFNTVLVDDSVGSAIAVTNPPQYSRNRMNADSIRLGDCQAVKKRCHRSYQASLSVGRCLGNR